MATRVSGAPLSSDELQQLCAAASASGSLVSLHMIAEAGESTVRALCYVVKRRNGGFMIPLPMEEALHNFVNTYQVEGEPIFVSHVCEVEMENSRGRPLGSGQVLLVDAAWDQSPMFRRATTLRGDASRALLRFTMDGVAARPNQASVGARAESWIHDVMDDDTAAEYVTGMEDEAEGALLDGEPVVPEEVPGFSTGAAPAAVSELEAMRRRMSEMEAMLRGQALHQAGVSGATGSGNRSRQTLLGSAGQPERSPAAVLEQMRMPGPG